ncbi:unnamed protein product [Diatraea saccharalis]|uniref:DNA-directed DNA polymerase family A palm domain-containing protein n=1 Tax=Diatraea saccharalis TaxID=40085 RepID=A0A9N9W9M7_9NEOP|nr:unnamed protein product [Diatraea saccharalis]
MHYLSFRDSGCYTPVSSSLEPKRYSGPTVDSPGQVELLNVKTDENENPNVISRDNFVNISTKSNTVLHEFNQTAKLNSVSGEREQIITGFHTKKLPLETSHRIDVNWDDMLDTELFQDTVTAQIDQCKSLSSDIDLIGDNGKLKSNKTSTKGSEKTTKTLHQDTKFKRKIKNTNTVKKWLNNVNQSVLDNINELNDELSDKENKTKSIDKIKEVIKKKVIQTKLANKDGVMKYGRPETRNIQDEKPEKQENKNLPPAKEVSEEKKSKSKFLAPIKSQLPIKNVSYEIFTLGDYDNPAEIIDMSDINDGTEILAVLVYRNGFCQLNSVYTEDACIIDGILLQINERFYFIDKINEDVKEIYNRIFEHNTLLCYDGKYILMYLLEFTGCRPDSIFDAKIAGALLDPDNLPENFSDIQKLLSYTPDYTIATECRLQKTAWYTTLLRECISKLKELLVENSLWKVFKDVEMRLLPIIAEMERFGVSVDMEKLKSMEQILLTKMKSVERECHLAAGRSFQINSPAQVRTLLYDDLKLDAFSQLRSLMSVHPLPKLILQYRRLHKAHATYLAGIAQQVKNGVVRPTWVQIAAATGRMASNNPNLQAIPKAPFNLDMFCEGAGGQALQLRAVYVPRAGRTLLAADFRHVECRVFAAAAADQALLAALQHDDLFRALAADCRLVKRSANRQMSPAIPTNSPRSDMRTDGVRPLLVELFNDGRDISVATFRLNKSEADVSPADRERTKRIVYASLYGCGANKLMDILDVTYRQALDVLASFNAKFPSLRSFASRVREQCARAGGRLRTAGGRVRAFPAPGGARQLRQAVNYLVQGYTLIYYNKRPCSDLPAEVDLRKTSQDSRSAADLCKVAMVSVERRLSSRPGAARLLLQIHDELVWEVRTEHLHWAAGESLVTSCRYSTDKRRRRIQINLPVVFKVGNVPNKQTNNKNEALHSGVVKETMQCCGQQCGLPQRLPVAVCAGADWANMAPV